MSSSQATLEQPSAHSGLVSVQRSRPPSLGCGIPVTTTLRPLAGRPVGSASGETGQVKQAFKIFGVLAPRKHRRAVTGDSLTPLQELPESATSADVDQPDVKRTYTDRTPQCFCVDDIQSEDEEDVVATIAEVNQCYQDHVNAVRSRSVYCMLSDTEYSDFDESDEEDEWAKYQQAYLSSDRCPPSFSVPLLLHVLCWTRVSPVFNHRSLSWTRSHQCIQVQPLHSTLLQTHYSVLTPPLRPLRLLHLCICLRRIHIPNLTSRSLQTSSTLSQTLACPGRLLLRMY